jgi:hypothetical protein
MPDFKPPPCFFPIRILQKAYQSIQKKQKDTKGEYLMPCQVLCSDECLIGLQSKAC